MAQAGTGRRDRAQSLGLAFSLRQRLPFPQIPWTNSFINRQALIDGPSTGVPRQAFPYKHLVLTPLKLSKLPRGAGSGVIKKQLEKEATLDKWEKSKWTQRRLALEKRRSLNDFGRFQVMLAKKQRRDVIRRKLKASA